MNNDWSSYGVEDYIDAITALHEKGLWTDMREKMLKVQYQAPKRTLIEPELTFLMGWTGHNGNAHYGKLGKLIGAELLGVGVESLDKGWPFLSSGEWREGDERWPGQRFYWTMRPALAAALEKMMMVVSAEAAFEPEPEFGELPPRTYPEGAARQVLVNAHERNPAAREACIAYHGSFCAVCDSDLEEFYGPIAYGFIHVHHLKPLSEIGEGYSVDPETDLVPVCPNCHAMLHRRTPPLTVEELRERIQEAHR
ncbi:HNH endonuclease [Deinococcus sp.]|uniref:HNH endonuclease n=1 Tax=Deinococcus sp. TaxID=47478 RepID=UPI003B5BAF08